MIRYTAMNKTMAAVAALVCTVLLAGVAPVGAVTEAVNADRYDPDRLVGVSFSGGTGGTMTLTFAKMKSTGPGAIWPYGAGLVVSGPGNVFNGDYRNVSQVSVRISAQGAYEPRQLILFMSVAGSGAEWQYSLSGAAAGQDEVVAPLRFDAGWRLSIGGGTAEDWNNCISQVARIGLRICAGSSAGAQSFTVSDFMLDDVSGAVFVPERVLAYFGVSSASEITEAMMAADGDNDQDGVKNYLEVWAGTDMNGENSVFAAKIVEVNGDIVTLEWPYATDLTYTVLRAAKLGGGFGVLDARVDAANTLTTVVGDEMRYLDVTAKEGEACFYKVVIE
ncbi:MAG: hypothetical protein FJ225_03910 [Lentisphaerae bacterium]|nr:hypothetical protein [Lentisphaerota bacterium]